MNKNVVSWMTWSRAGVNFWTTKDCAVKDANRMLADEESDVCVAQITQRSFLTKEGTYALQPIARAEADNAIRMAQVEAVVTALIEGTSRFTSSEILRQRLREVWAEVKENVPVTAEPPDCAIGENDAVILDWGTSDIYAFLKVNQDGSVSCCFSSRLRNSMCINANMSKRVWSSVNYSEEIKTGLHPFFTALRAYWAKQNEARRMSAVYLRVEAFIRYWEGAMVNGEQDERGTLIPFRSANLWCPRIRLTDGVVMDWPSGMEAEICYRVCDMGRYWLQDGDGNDIAKYAGSYVPDKFLCHGEQGYGDYIIMDIEADGTIAQYEPPVIDMDDWDIVSRVQHA